MREIRRSATFRRDYKRERSGQHGAHLDALLREVLESLLADVSLPPARRDHNLSGNWAGFRECHLRPDLLLVYSRPDGATLDLVRMGSHSELFG